MRRGAHMIAMGGTIALSLMLAACGGGGDKSGNSVQMKDMEVVDGTATDAMTDLDGVQAEGTAVMPAVSGAGNMANAASAHRAGEEPDADTESEVLSDQ
ncbi:MAG: hypothetical protein AB7E60_09585 [Sphingobium sp.]